MIYVIHGETMRYIHIHGDLYICIATKIYKLASGNNIFGEDYNEKIIN